MYLQNEKSLGRRLLKTVFGLYFIVALMVTLGQLFFEYQQIEKRILADMQEGFSISKDSLSLALWNVEEEQIITALNGYKALESVAGAKVIDSSDSEVGTTGITAAQADESTRYQESKEVTTYQVTTPENSYKLFEYTFPVIFIEDEEENKVGNLFLYSTSDVVFDQFATSFFLIVANSIVKTLSLWVIFLIAVRLLVEKPLNHLEDIAASFNPDNPTRTGEIDRITKQAERADEVGRLSQQFLKMINTVTSYLDKIKDFTQNLEGLVERRTKELAEKNQKFEHVIERIDVGIMVLDEDLVLQSEYSEKAREILHLSEFAGKTLEEVLLNHTDLSGEKRDFIKLSLFNMVGESELNFQLNLPNLPPILQFQSPSGHLIRLDLTWNAIYVEDQVKFILLTFKDMTSHEENAAQQLRANRELTVVNEILNVPPERLDIFLRSSDQQIRHLEELIEFGPDYQPGLLQKILMELHSYKGNSRILRFQELVEVTHSAENDFHACLKDGTKVPLDTARQHIANIRQNHEYLLDILNKRIAIFGAYQLQKSLRTQMENQSDQANSLSQINRIIYSSIGSEQATTFSNLAHQSFQFLKSECEIRGLSVPKLVFHDDAEIKPEYLDKIASIFSHCFNNILSHAMQTREQRAFAELSHETTVKVGIQHNKDHIVLVIEDDGKGIDIERIRNKTADADKLTDEQIANKIFAAGMSTAKQTDHSAGRGIGMAAIYSLCEELGGFAEIKLSSEKAGKNTNNRRFSLHLHLRPDTLVNPQAA